MPEPMKLTKERRERVAHHLQKAAIALIDAQVEMLMDTPSIYEYELAKRLSPELLSLYTAANKAEAATVLAQFLLEGD